MITWSTAPKAKKKKRLNSIFINQKGQHIENGVHQSDVQHILQSQIQDMIDNGHLPNPEMRGKLLQSVTVRMDMDVVLLA